jgi:hypothetical protein
VRPGSLTERATSNARREEGMTYLELAMANIGEPMRRQDSAGSLNSSRQRTEPLFITGYTVKDAALGQPRIRAGEIIGWRIWRLYDGLLQSVTFSYIWRPGVFERSRLQRGGWECNLGYHAFKDKEQADREASAHWSPIVIGSVGM